MKIQLKKDGSIPLYLQIVEQIKEQILSGEIPSGYRLPPERRLAESIGVNRTTVLNAYRELKAENLIGSHVGKGTVVLSIAEEIMLLSGSQQGIDLAARVFIDPGDIVLVEEPTFFRPLRYFARQEPG